MADPIHAFEADGTPSPGAQTALDGKADVGHTHAWGEVTGKPVTYAPSAHTHAQSEVTGLESRLDALSAAPTAYVATWGPNASSGANTDSDGRRMLRVRAGWGVMRVDFKVSTNGSQVAATLPAGAPTPVDTIEVQVHDGGTVWISPGSREVKSGVTANTRYIVNLAGFWQ